MAEQVALTLLGKVVEILVDPIWCQFSYLFCYNSNIKNLTEGVQKLQNKRHDVQLLVDAADRNAEIIREEVAAWLRNVDEIESNAHKVDEDTKNVKNGCLNGWGPKGLKRRYSLSRKAVKQNVLVVKLQEEGKAYYTQVSQPPLPAGMVASTSTVGSEVFQSRISMMKEVLETLMNDQTHTIGICGLGGVGKTRMVNEIRKNSIVEKLFDEVAMAVVSQKQDLSKIQGELAKMLGLDLDEKDSTGVRAKKLLDRLMQKNRTLIILDDVWKKLELGDVGIPVHGEGGCKLLLTTRDERVCSTMRTQKVFKVQVLSDQEAWDLFKEKAGECVETPDIRPIAMHVLKECGRLPLAIVTVGSALNGEQEYAWCNALQQLRTSTARSIEGMDADVYSSLQLSFDYLNQDQHSTQEKKSNGIQRLFLLCCLFPEGHDIPIEYLVRYAVGLKLFEHIQNLAAVRNRVQALADRLKSCYLLLDSDIGGHVKIHDVIRDFGLAFATEGDHVYMVKHNTGLEEWPENGQTSTVISLHEEALDLPVHLDWPQLTLLELSAEGSIEISRDCFGGMEELRVVAFRNKSIYSEQMQVEAPPKAIKFFTNVRSLSLEYCRFDSHIGFIRSLQKLEILSFYGSEIDVLPKEIGQLTNLKLLDLRCKWLDLIPSGVLSCLSKLEALYTGYYFHGYGFEGRRHGARITELNELSRVRTLQIWVSDLDLLLELPDFFLKELLRFSISVTPKEDTYHFDFGYEFRNVLRLSLDKRISILPFMTKMKALSSRIEYLHVPGLGDLKTITSELDEEIFLKLKVLYISHCDYLTEICEGRLPPRSFERLESVTLQGLCSLERLWRGPIEPPCLSNLTLIRLTSCDAIKSLFSPSVVKCLVQLQELRVCNCRMLEEIVSKEGAEYEKDAQIIQFPKLKNLSLTILPSLRSFNPISDTLSSQSNTSHEVIIQPLLNQVILPSLEILQLERLGLGCFNVKHLAGDLIEARSLCKLKVLELVHDDEVVHIVVSDYVQLLQKLEKLEVRECSSVETVFDFEGREEHAESMLPQLHSIKLRRLPVLTHLWKMVPKGIQGFQNLINLEVYDCDSMRYLFCPSIAKLLVNIKTISLSWCRKMELVIQTNEEDDDGCLGSEIHKIYKFVFLQLRVLTLVGLESLTMFCHGNHDIEFPSLEEMKVYGCSELKNFSLVRPSPGRTESFRNLRKLSVANCERLRYLFTPSMAEILVNLKELEVEDSKTMEVIIQKEDEDYYNYYSSSETEKLDKVLVFPQLNILTLLCLENLTMFCFGNHDIQFPSLDCLFIGDCPKMMHFCSGQLSTPKLEHVKYNSKDEGLVNDLNNTIRILNERQ